MNITALTDKAELLSQVKFAEISALSRFSSEKILRAFTNARVSSADFAGTNGYGYGDTGRERIDTVFAEITGSEAALVRHNFINGTHAIATALFGVLRPGDLLLSVTGKPYNTLRDVISGKPGSLSAYNIAYDEISLLPDGEPDYAAIADKAPRATAIFIQRSRGYTFRPALGIDTIAKIVSVAKLANPGVTVLVDNCYGELTEKKEPTEVGADLIMGSLIKNFGGGITDTGGYIAGRADLVSLAADRLTTPGIGGEAGSTGNANRGILIGLYHSGQAVGNALRTAVFAQALFGLMGYGVYPEYSGQHSDIVTLLELGSEEKLLKFCRAVQGASPVDSFLTPEPWDMPGYDCRVVMAAGAFTMGASIELSADAPVIPPYAVWFQGGNIYDTAKYGIVQAAAAIEEL
ncbi:hypothetical protein FACS189499_02740 [Clostridia bacterium]|nr:hypothetical protein FACS189499_02740 [Clostridia bacterium]